MGRSPGVLVTLWLEGEMPANPGAWSVRTVVHRSLHFAEPVPSPQARRSSPTHVVEPSDQDDPRSMEADELSHILRQAL